MMLQHIMKEDASSLITENLKKVAIKEVIYLIAESWDMISSWNNLLPGNNHYIDFEIGEEAIEAFSHIGGLQVLEKTIKYVSEQGIAVPEDCGGTMQFILPPILNFNCLISVYI